MELDSNHISYLTDEMSNNGIQFGKGLTATEIFQVEEKFDVRFPPDLRTFLMTSLPLSQGFVNWRLGLTSKEQEDKIKSSLNWPLEGMLFDVDNAQYWEKKWGDRPENIFEQKKIVVSAFDLLPKLVPIFGHRYIASEPLLAGNPVFSIYQMDIIFYGYNFPDYLAREFNFSLSDNFVVPEKPRRIDFWSAIALGETNPYSN